MISRQIQLAHQQEDYHIRLLQQHGRYIRFLEDCSWNPGSDAGHPEIAVPVYRIDFWMNGYTSEIVEHNTTSDLKGKVSSLVGFDEAFIQEIKSRRSGIAALKCAIAYERSIDFQSVDRSEILAIYGKPLSDITENEKKKFGDYVFALAAQLAAELEILVQIHTELAQLSGSNPMLLESIIARFPKTRFVLFHGGLLIEYWTSLLISVNLDIPE